MSFLSVCTPFIGKSVRAVARLRGGGTALPGRVIEKIDPDFMARTLAQLPYGVVLVSGTNGKTTTTRIVSSMLVSLGLKVFTNPTGSNFTRGVISALLDKVSMGGKLDADIAVLELDEAYAVHFVKQVKPRYSLLLNVLRDQLDRFGEIDTTARMLSAVAESTRGTVVLNREDPRIASLADVVKRSEGAQVAYFGLSDDLMSFFPTDDTMYSDIEENEGAQNNFDLAHYRPASVTLTSLQGNAANFTFAHDGGNDGGKNTTYEAHLKLEGVYNAFNVAAALALVRDIMGREASDAELIRAATEVTPAFGRGESITINEDTVELILVKNPMGFRLALKSFSPRDCATMIVINDEYADGRDMSWLWDVDFTSLTQDGVQMVSGVRATDMALRLAYDGVTDPTVESDIPHALKVFLDQTQGKKKHIYCTYTAMLAVRKALAQYGEVEDVGL